jgi:hypothetical protein
MCWSRASWLLNQRLQSLQYFSGMLAPRPSGQLEDLKGSSAFTAYLEIGFLLAESLLLAHALNMSRIDSGFWSFFSAADVKI